MQTWCTVFPILNQAIVPCLVLTVVSWPAYTFLRRQARWSGVPIFLRIFPNLFWLYFEIWPLSCGVNLRFLAGTHIGLGSPMGNMHPNPLPIVGSGLGPFHWPVMGSFHFTCISGLISWLDQCFWKHGIGSFFEKFEMFKECHSKLLVRAYRNSSNNGTFVITPESHITPRDKP